MGDDELDWGRGFTNRNVAAAEGFCKSTYLLLWSDSGLLQFKLDVRPHCLHETSADVSYVGHIQKVQFLNVLLHYNGLDCDDVVE